MCLTLNYEAEYALIRSHSSIPRRIASNFEYQRSLVKEALHSKRDPALHRQLDIRPHQSA